MRLLKTVVVLLGGLTAGWPLSVSAGEPAPKGPTRGAEWEKRVISLVEKLGHDQYYQREAAQRALLKEGPAILPVLDKLGPQADPEIQFRLRTLRYRLVGFLDDIRRCLAASPEIEHESRPSLPPELQGLISSHQPKSGDLLLSIIADPENKLNRRATNAFLHTWDSMTRAQIETYFRHAMKPWVRLRKQYPQHVDASIAMGYSVRYAWGGWPSEKDFQMQTATTHFLDGKPYGKPFAYEGPMAGTGWVRTEDLAIGKHSFHLLTEYKFVRDGRTCTGRMESQKYEFEIVPAETPDDLVAPNDTQVDELVRKSFQFLEIRHSLGGPLINQTRPLGPEEDPWEPQITWESGTGESGGLHMPLWRLTAELPVDLCFEVEIHLQQTGKVFEGDPLVVPKGMKTEGYFFPRQSVSEFARGREGFIPLKLVLKPSRAMALTDTRVTRYYPGRITSEVLRAKVAHR